jgi:hypothetical protein
MGDIAVECASNGMADHGERDERRQGQRHVGAVGHKLVNGLFVQCHEHIGGLDRYPGLFLPSCRSWEGNEWGV